jgi:O-antigen ligase
MRAFLCLLAASWGLRSAVELAFPEARDSAIIVLEGETLFRRTDPLGPIAIPLLMGLLFSERHGDRRLLLGGSLALIVTQNLLGFTRAHYLALGVAVPLLLLVALRRPQVRGTALHAVLIGVLAAGALYGAVSPVRGEVDRAWDRFLATFDPTTQSRLHREMEGEAVLTYVRSAPLTGYGLGFEYEGVDPETLRGEPIHFVHNDYLALWLRGGILLSAVWVAILAYSAWRGFTRSNRLGALVSAGAASGVLAEAITAFFSGSAFGYVAGPVMALAIAVGMWQPGKEALPLTSKRRPYGVAPAGQGLSRFNRAANEGVARGG